MENLAPQIPLKQSSSQLKPVPLLGFTWIYLSIYAPRVFIYTPYKVIPQLLQGKKSQPIHSLLFSIQAL